MMAAELRPASASSSNRALDLERKNLEVDARRRYIETILERVATGVISLDADGRIETSTARRCACSGSTDAVVGAPAADVLRARGSAAARGRCVEARRSRHAPSAAAQEITLARDGRELHLAAAATPLQGEDGAFEGAVLVLDDVTPLIRAQRVAAWRDVARRLAHEIKNPLTPIQLCAERLRRHFSGAPPAHARAGRRVHDAIIAEVEALKGLVDEFAQFARMPAPRMVPADLNALLDDTLRLYAGLFNERPRSSGASPTAAARSASTPNRSGRSSSTSSTTRSRRSAAARRRRARTASRRRSSSRRTHDAAQRRRAARRRRQRPRRPGGRPRQAVHAVLLDQGPRQRPRPRDRPPHHRRARRQHRGRRNAPAGTVFTIELPCERQLEGAETWKRVQKWEGLRRVLNETQS